MKTTKKKGRKRIGQPISITLTPEQRAWVDMHIPEGGTRTEVIRAIINQFMRTPFDLPFMRKAKRAAD